MRIKQAAVKGDLRVSAISGTHVVVLAFDLPEKSPQLNDLLGFAIHRAERRENQSSPGFYVSSFRKFAPVTDGVEESKIIDDSDLSGEGNNSDEPDPEGTGLRVEALSSLVCPIQDFNWSDYTAKPNRTYTYTVVPMYGPFDPTTRRCFAATDTQVKLTIQTEPQEFAWNAPQEHSVFFNRGVAGSQAYSRKFGAATPAEVPNRRAYIWLSRGLEEAMLGYILQAKGSDFAIRGAFYQFTYVAVLKAFRQAADSGADVKLIYDAKKASNREEAEPCIRAAGIEDLVIPRRKGTSAIAHNKFIVILYKNEPVCVWTGSTNVTESGIFGQSNCAHIVRGRAIASLFYEYWLQLEKDNTKKPMQTWNAVATPTPAFPSNSLPSGTTVLFSPQPTLSTLEWYTDLFESATSSVCLTAAFGINALFSDSLKANQRHYLRYLLTDKRIKRDLWVQIQKDPLIELAVGAVLSSDVTQALDDRLDEKVTGLNKHVEYIHNKFLLIDALSSNPVIVSGSANFSKSSTYNNDENMLVVKGNTQVADVYFSEFLRLFRHHRYRNKINNEMWKKKKEAAEAAANGSLREKENTTAVKDNALGNDNDDSKNDNSQTISLTPNYLRADNSWTYKYYKPNTVWYEERCMFFLDEGKSEPALSPKSSSSSSSSSSSLSSSSSSSSSPSSEQKGSGASQLVLSSLERIKELHTTPAKKRSKRKVTSDKKVSPLPSSPSSSSSLSSSSIIQKIEPTQDISTGKNDTKSHALSSPSLSNSSEKFVADRASKEAYVDLLLDLSNKVARLEVREEQLLHVLDQVRTEISSNRDAIIIAKRKLLDL